MKCPVGYGVCIRNTPIDKEKTVAYQELNAIGYNNDEAIIDIVRSDTVNRPELQKLIDTLGKDDRIDMYSIGADILKALIKAEKDEAKRNALVDELMQVHDRHIN